MNRDEILTRAERHSKMAAGWIFNASGLEAYWKEAYEKGRKDQKADCADLIENADFTNPNLLAQGDVMNRDSILKMAREAGLLRGGDGWTEPHRWGITELERFAALIEQHLSYDGIHTCHAECQRPACVAVREAVTAEREGCAQLCESYGPARVLSGEDCAAAIRTKGQKLEQKANVHDKVYSEVDLANAYQKGWDDAMLRRSIGARGER